MRVKKKEAEGINGFMGTKANQPVASVTGHPC